jgi:SAM-dependent MidA family methyltransferase
VTLAERLKDKILATGPISFRDYMDNCLYYPGLGYYDSETEKIGAGGDFITSPVITPLFAQLIARQLEEMWNILGKKDFTVIEYGAGTGVLCRDILNALKKNDELYSKLHYCIIEKSASMRRKEKLLLTEKVEWHDNLADIPYNISCILANEVLDNFPIHKVEMKEELMEAFVNYENGFVEVLKPASQQIKDYFGNLHIELPANVKAEVNLEALNWIKEISGHLKSGFIITIDYGYLATELLHYSKSQGTLSCFSKHKVNLNPYQFPGEQDITAHVNFSALHHYGLQNGLQTCGYTDQFHFLQGLGLVNLLREQEQQHAYEEVSGEKKEFLLSTFFMDMGKKFKVLIQQKGIPRSFLSGMRFANTNILNY